MTDSPVADFLTAVILLTLSLQWLLKVSFVLFRPFFCHKGFSWPACIYLVFLTDEQLSRMSLNESANAHHSTLMNSHSPILTNCIIDELHESHEGIFNLPSLKVKYTTDTTPERQHFRPNVQFVWVKNRLNISN